MNPGDRSGYNRNVPDAPKDVVITLIFSRRFGGSQVRDMECEGVFEKHSWGGCFGKHSGDLGGFRKHSWFLSGTQRRYGSISTGIRGVFEGFGGY